jgi:hypothetical protein
VIEVEVQATVELMIAAAAAISTALEAVTDLAMIRADWIVRAVDAGFAVTAGANVDVGGTVSGLLHDGNGKKGSLKIPGLKAEFVNPDGTIDLEDSDVAAYLALFEEDGGIAYISDGEQVDSWIKGALDK